MEPRIADSLSSSTSTENEIKQAVEQNTIDRGTFFVRMMASFDIEGMLQELEQLALDYDKEDWREQAGALGIHPDALDRLDASDPPVPYVYYFSTPELLSLHPRLIFYYRNVAMLSRKVMREIGFDTERYESGDAIPDEATAVELSAYFNEIVSALVQAGGVTPQRHMTMLMANIGDVMGRIAAAE